MYNLKRKCELKYLKLFIFRSFVLLYFSISCFFTIYLHVRGVFRTHSNIYDGALLRKKLTAKSIIVDCPLDFKYASAGVDPT